MIYFEIKDESGKVIAGNMQSFSRRNDFEDNKDFSEHKNGNGLRGICEKVSDTNFWFVVENEPDLLRSSKIFEKTFELHKIIALIIRAQYKNEINAYAHTLNTIQAQIRQKIDNFSDSSNFYGESYENSISNITNVITSDTKSAADLICYLQKRVLDMRAHLLGVEVIHLGEQYEIKPVLVSLKRAILNQCTPFLEELEKNMVKIKFFFEDSCEIEVDKNMFSLVMYNFFSNTVKYAKPNSEVRFNYSNDQKSLDISMISLKMEKSELKYLSNDGVRGLHAKNIPGKGIGLFVVQKSLELMKKDRMFISPDYEKSESYEGSIYNENHFKFKL